MEFQAKNQAFESALGEIGLAVQKILGGAVENNAAEIFILMAENPDWTAKKIARFIKNKRQREEKSGTFSGRCDGRRVAPLAQGAVVAGGIDGGMPVIEQIDFESPDSILEASEEIDLIPGKKELINRANRVDEAELKSWGEIAEHFHCSRRNAFLIKKKNVENAENEDQLVLDFE